MQIISLVPSITETLFDFGLTEKEIIGRTKFCIHPKDDVKKVEIIGGTKNLNLAKIKSLNPTLIIANKEENVKEQVEELMHNFDVWLTEIDTLTDNRNFLSKLGELLNKNELAHSYISSTDEIFADLKKNRTLKKAAYLIWKEPYMAVGSSTFINEMMKETGFDNIFRNRQRYPEVTLEELETAEYILLSTEPYPFNEKHCEDFQKTFPGKKIILVDGEAFSWYGTHLSKCTDYYKKLAAM